MQVPGPSGLAPPLGSRTPPTAGGKLAPTCLLQSSRAAPAARLSAPLLSHVPPRCAPTPRSRHRMSRSKSRGCASARGPATHRARGSGRANRRALAAVPPVTAAQQCRRRHLRPTEALAMQTCCGWEDSYQEAHATSRTGRARAPSGGRRPACSAAQARPHRAPAAAGCAAPPRPASQAPPP